METIEFDNLQNTNIFTKCAPVATQSAVSKQLIHKVLIQKHENILLCSHGKIQIQIQQVKTRDSLKEVIEGLRVFV
jgi:hypothetical protein